MVSGSLFLTPGAVCSVWLGCASSWRQLDIIMGTRTAPVLWLQVALSLVGGGNAPSGERSVRPLHPRPYAPPTSQSKSPVPLLIKFFIRG